MIQSVLVAYDGSPPSINGFEFGADLSRRLHAALHVITVVDVPEFHDEIEKEPVMHRAKRLHRKILDDLRQAAEIRCISAEFHLGNGRIATQVVEFAAGHGIGLIVLGHKGQGSIDRYNPGSVCHAVVSKAPCNVLIVR